MIAAAYIRVSTEDQIEFSPDSQLKRIQEYASQHNIQIPNEYIFVDEGISGRDAKKRPAFQNMITLARTKRAFQKILVWKFSRFARNRQDSIFYKSMLRKDCGIEVISITEPLSDDPTSILIEALLEAMDEYYSINLAQEVRRGMQERFSRGKAISLPPFGYQMGQDSFEPHPAQAVWVRYMFQAYADGSDLPEIAKQLNQFGIHTNRGNPFQPRSIAYILLNPVYIGKLRKRSDNKQLNQFYQTKSPNCILNTAMIYDRNYEYTSMDYVDGSHLPLIDLELWTAVQERWHIQHSDKYSCLHPKSAFQQITSTNASPDNAVSCSQIYELQGLVHCSHCGKHLVSIHKGTAFQCSGYNHGKCKVSHYIKADLLKQLVYEAVSPLLPPSTAFFLQCKDTAPAEKNQILHLLDREITYDSIDKQIHLSNKK